MQTRRRLLPVVAAVAVGLAVGFTLGARLYDGVLADYQGLRTTIRRQEAVIEGKDQQVANLEIADKVNRLTQEKLREKVAELQTDLVKLEGQVYLYKNLVDDDEAEIGLNLESFTMLPAEGDNRFSYRIVVRRKAALSQTIEASLTLAIEGSRDGVPYSIGYGDVDPAVGGETLDFKFKYFRVIEGVFELPEGFVPEKVILSLYEAGRPESLAIIEQPWKVSST